MNLPRTLLYMVLAGTSFSAIAEMNLRSQAKTLSWQDIQSTIQTFGLAHGQKNKKAQVDNQYMDMNDGTIVDRATGLMWQKKGADNEMDHAAAEAWAKQVASSGFAGHSDWRLPTAEELGTIVEPLKNKNRFYIDPIFVGQKGTWTGDTASEESSRGDGSKQAWFANFFYGYGLNWEGAKQKWGVRLVRRVDGAAPRAGGQAQASAEQTLFDNWNKSSVQNGATYAPLIELQETRTITRIINYHWNNGKGQKPGMISLVDESGRIYGSWQAKGTPGTNNAQNVNWEVTPNIELEPGAYFVIDSHMPSWSANAGSNYFGFSHVMYGSGGATSTESPNAPPVVKTGLDAFKRMEGYAISYHNINIPGKGQYIYVPVEECAEACLAIDACKSFDYLRAQRKCALNDVARDKAGSSWVKAAEYDNYERID